MKELTKAEEQVMQYVWKLKKAFLKDIVEAYPEPKPAYTTISTVVRVLVKKQYLTFEAYGKIRQYQATVSKAQYFKGHINRVVTDFFGGSKKQFANFFTEDENLKVQELEEIQNMIQEKINKLKENGQ